MFDIFSLQRHTSKRHPSVRKRGKTKNKTKYEVYPTKLENHDYKIKKYIEGFKNTSRRRAMVKS